MDFESLIQSNNKLAINLHSAFDRDGKNVFFSPCGVSSLLAMLLYGTRGKAESELRKCLSYENVTNDVLAKTFQSTVSSLSNIQDNYSVTLANSVVIQKDFEVSEQYKTDLSNYFKALCLQADFVEESPIAVEQINNWVKKNTNNMIPQILDSLDEFTVMVFLNAVYFKGFWLKKFEEEFTCMQPFYNNGIKNAVPLVDMMHLTDYFMWFENESYEVLQLPYKGEKIAMLVFLPKSRDGLQEMEDLLTPNLISEIKKEMYEVEIEVALPKFRLEYSKDLKETLEDLGVKQIFKMGADFGGISSCKNLFVSEVLHKAVLEVNEEGCEAAAATAGITTRCIPPKFIADHPFAFVIYNVRNDFILFMGRVTEL